MSSPVRIPADLELEDRILGRLTGRQALILGSTAAVLWLAWTALHALVPVPVFLALAVPVAAATIVVALGRRDGVSLDRHLVAMLRHFLGTRRPRHDHTGVPEWLAAPAATPTAALGGPRHPTTPVWLPPERVGETGMSETGVIDLGPHGLAVVAVCSTLPFGLRTPVEQDGLVAVWARYLHALSAPVQVLIRAMPLDTSPHIGRLHAAAAALPHPALTAACLDHADYLTDLGERHELLRRQVVLVLREPAAATPTRRGPHGPSAGRRPDRPADDHNPSRRRPGRTNGREARQAAAETRLVRRLAEAAELLAPAGITVTGLDAAQAAAVLAAATHPARLLPPTTPPDDPDEITSGR